jgi:CO/xanthine dehydrogenase Mo-binding subunit
MAEIIGLPITKVRVIPSFVGGDFGGKGMIFDEPLCYYLARKARRPVKMVMSRQEEFLAGTPRHPSIIWLKAGVTKAGAIVAWEADATYDSGAYAAYKPQVGLGGTKNWPAHTESQRSYRRPLRLYSFAAVRPLPRARRSASLICG